VDSLPSWIQIDMGSSYNIHAIAYTPRQDGSSNGNIGAHRTEVSTDSSNWVLVATGTYANDPGVKKVTFVTRPARYVRITITSEAQGTGLQYASVAELAVYHEVSYNYASRTGWSVAADSQETTSENSPASNAIDGNLGTLWHTKYSDAQAPLPHWFQIDAGAQISVTGFSYTPRQTQANGRIGNYSIQTSNDSTTWTQAAAGLWADDGTDKVVLFNAKARYFKLNAFSEAGDRGQWSSASEINLVSGSTFVNPPAPAPSKGLWINTVEFPLVPVAVANLPNGKVLVWSAYARDNYGGANGYTQTAIYDPATGQSTSRTVTNTAHDMFCPGISMDFNGRIIISGGSNAGRTSIYDPSSDSWTTGPTLKITRAYQSTTTCSDGRVFSIGGSWNGGLGGKNGEIYSPSGNAWSLVQNALVSPMLTADRGGVYRSDNHAWLFAWKNQTA